jgi:hypothetical protein
MTWVALRSAARTLLNLYFTPIVGGWKYGHHPIRCGRTDHAGGPVCAGLSGSAPTVCDRGVASSANLDGKSQQA